MSQEQISYIIDVVVGALIAGGIAAGEQYTTTGVFDTHTLLIAAIGGALGFARKWAQVNYGVDAPPSSTKVSTNAGPTA